MNIHVPGLSTGIHARFPQWDRERGWLLGLLLFNGIGATGGGIAMLTGDIGLPLELLEGTPFTSYTIPAWILAVVVGGTSLTAAFGVWRRRPFAGEESLLAGAALFGWIVTEFMMIPEAWAPQLLYFLTALTILWLGWRTRGRLSPGPTP